MIIIVNTTTAFKGGSVQVALSFLIEFRKFNNFEFHIFVGPGLRDLIEAQDFPGNFKFYFFEHRPSQRFFTTKPLSVEFEKIEKKIKADFVITTSGPSYWRPSCPHIIGYNLPHYVYSDSPFWSIAKISTKLRFYFLKFIIRYFYKKDADYYFVQTDDVRDRLINFINSKNVFTVPNTCGFSKGIGDNDLKFLPRRNKETFRFLTLSAYYEHKNLEILSLVSKKLESLGIFNVEFILTLSNEAFLKCFNRDKPSGVINVGPVKPKDCPNLYDECDAIILPTLLECFSANYVEAMFMKKPIITTDLSFARTVCKDAALYFQPLSADDATEKIVTFIGNQDLRSRLVEKGTARLQDFPNAAERASMIIDIINALLLKNK